MTEGPMSGPHECGGDAAAYALGALEPAEAEAFRRHMSHCVVCRDEVNQFRRVADGLALSTPQYPVSRGLRRRVLRQVRAEPRATATARRRRALVVPRPVRVAAATLAVAIAVVAGVALIVGGASRRVIQTTAATLTISGDRAELKVHRLPASPAGQTYELWVQHGSRPPSPSTLFSVTSRGTADLGVPGSVDGVSAVLVTQEPAGGTLTPTHPPVISIKL